MKLPSGFRDQRDLLFAVAGLGAFFYELIWGGKSPVVLAICLGAAGVVVPMRADESRPLRKRDKP